MCQTAGKTGLVMAVGFSVFTLAISASAQCVQEPPKYQGYRVNDVRVTSPLGFFSAATFGLSDLPSVLPLKKGGTFDVDKYNDGVGEVTQHVRSHFIDGFAAMRFVISVGRLENCGINAVDVNYVVYTALIPPFSNHSFEERQAELERPATTGAALGTAGRFLVAPDFGYNHTRRGYGGGTFRSQVPHGLFDHLSIYGSGSSDSLVDNIHLSGERSPATRFLSQAEWDLSSRYYDVPAGAQQMKEGTLALAFFGSTKELLADAVVAHYGASVAGGHQQSFVQDSPNSSYGDLKFLSGIESRTSMNAFAASYGIQLGSTFAGHTVDFVKHIVDFRYSTGFTPLPKYLLHPVSTEDDRPDFIGRVHHILSIETQVNAGLIQDRGRVPGVERFFGGNQQSAPFIDGQPWDVRGQPYIRSIPENGLGSSGSLFGVGGTRFYSFNMTLAKCFYGKALLPKELGSIDFVNNLDFGMKTAKGELADTYFGKDPVVVAATTDIRAIKTEIDSIKNEISSLPVEVATDPQIGQITKKLRSSLTIADLTADAILNKGKGNETSIFLNSQVPSIESNLERLCSAFTDQEQAPLARHLEHLRETLESSRERLADNWTNTNTKAARVQANADAQKDFSRTEKVLNSILYELNAYSLAPVAIFDAARVWPSEIGTRYAIGGGARLSIVNVNFTVGYAANPKPVLREGSGALFFKLDVTDMFH